MNDDVEADQQESQHEVEMIQPELSAPPAALPHDDHQEPYTMHRLHEFESSNVLEQQQKRQQQFLQSTINTKSPSNLKWESFEDDDDDDLQHPVNVDISLDDYESVPVDLSNDILVNQMMADQGAPVNPDAEIFNVDTFGSDEIPSLNQHNDEHREYLQRYLRSAS